MYAYRWQVNQTKLRYLRLGGGFWVLYVSIVGLVRKSCEAKHHLHLCAKWRATAVQGRVALERYQVQLRLRIAFRWHSSLQLNLVLYIQVPSEERIMDCL